MKFSIFLSKGLLFFSFLIVSQISFGQHPVVVNDSMVVNQRLYAKEKLIVTSEAQFKQNIKVTGTSTLTGAITANGAATFSSTVNMGSLSAESTMSRDNHFVIVLPSGQLKKVGLNAIAATMYSPPASIDVCSGGIAAQWWSGANKLYTPCPDIKVGIRTDSPTHALHVVGVTYAQKFIAGNVAGTTNAIINGFAQNNTDDLLELGVKIGGGSIENRFKIKNDGTVYAKELRIRIVSEFPDYVFADNYALMSLSELAQYIEKHNHLPNMPKASDVSKGGLAVGDVVVKLVEKVEELTLYTIALNKENEQLRNELDLLKGEVKTIKEMLNN